MVSTNLPELVRQLHELGTVRVTDRLDTIELRFDPMSTQRRSMMWSAMRVVNSGSSASYEC